MPLKGSSDYLTSRVEVLLQDDYKRWVNLSSDFDFEGGGNVIMNSKGISVNKEEDTILPNKFVTQLSSITLNNVDNWLDGPDFSPRFVEDIRYNSGKEVYGYAVTMSSGTTEYISIPHHPAIMPSTAFTIEEWVYLTDNPSGTGALFFKGDGVNTGMAIYMNLSGELKFTVYVGGGQSVETDYVAVEKNVWIHIVATWSVIRESDNEFIHTVRLYANGSLLDATTTTKTTNISNDTSTIYINRTDSAVCAGMTIDEIRYYSRALAYAEIMARYNNGQGIFGEIDAGLVLGYRCDEGSGSSINSYSNIVNAGTLNGSISWSTGHIANTIIQNSLSTKISSKYYFKLSKSKITKAWKDRKLKFIIRSIRKDGTFDIDELAVFLIKNSKNVGNTKVFDLQSISNKLDELPANKVTNSGSWYENASYPFIIKKLLATKLETNNNSVQLVDRHIIPSVIEKPTRNFILKKEGKLPSTIDWREFSTLGRPPEYTEGVNTGVFANSGGVVTAMEIYETSGTCSANSTEGTKTKIITGVGTDWVNALYLRPVAGDAIHLVDTSGENTGYYEIESVDSDTQITLKTPIKGSSLARRSTTMSFSIVKIFMAVCYKGAVNNTNEIWKYIPGLDKYILCLDDTTIRDGTISDTLPFSIQRLKIAYGTSVSPTADKIKLYALAISDQLSFGVVTPIDDRRTCKMYFIDLDTPDNNPSLTVTDLKMTISSNDHEPFNGLFHYRRGEYTDIFDGTVFGQRAVFNNEMVIGGEHLSIPFEQMIGDVQYNFPNPPIYHNPRRNTYPMTILCMKYPNFIYGSAEYQDDDGNNSINQGDILFFSNYYTEEQDLYEASEFGFSQEIPDDTNEYYIKFLKVSSGYYTYSIIQQGGFANDLMLRYSSNQKGAFAIGKGNLDMVISAEKDKRYYYFILSHKSYSPTYSTLRDATYRLITEETNTSSIIDSTVAGSYWYTTSFFAFGAKIYVTPNYNTTSNTTLILQPTYIEAIDDSNDIYISFMAWAWDNDSSPGEYPWHSEDFSVVYRINRYTSNNDASLEITNDFLGFSGFDRTSLNIVTATSFVCPSGEEVNLRKGDILRFDNTDGIGYAIIDSISGTTINLRDNDGAQGIVTHLSSSSGLTTRINVVARQIFISDETLDDDFGWIVPLETKTVYNDDGSIFTTISGLNRNRINTTEQYVLGYVDSIERSSSLSNPKYFKNQPEGLVSSVIGYDGAMGLSSSYNTIYFFSGGMLFSYTPNYSTNTGVSIRGNGQIPVEDELWLQCAPVIDKTTRYTSETQNDTSIKSDIIYAISSPTPPYWTQENLASGKYYLFKYDSYKNMRLPLAEFDDMSIWQALGYMAQRADYIMGFVGETFWFVPRERTSKYNIEPEFTIYLDDSGGEPTDAFSIEEIDYNESDIINSVTVVPNKVVLKEPEVSFLMKPRGTFDVNGILKDEYEPNVEITVQQRDTKKKSIKLSCVTGGFISQGVNEITQNITNPVKFRYLISQKTWETALFSPFTVGDGSMYISGETQNINLGDVLEIHYVKESGSEEISNTTYVGTFVVARKPKSIDSDYVQGFIYVTLVGWEPSTPTDIIPIGTKVVIRSDNKWSDYNRNLVVNSEFDTWSAGNQGWATPNNWSCVSLFGVSQIEKMEDTPYTSSAYLRHTPASGAGGLGRRGEISQDISIDNSTYTLSLVFRGTITAIDIEGSAITIPDEVYPIISDEWREIRAQFTGVSGVKTLKISHSNSLDLDSVLVVRGSIINREYLSVSTHDFFYEIGESGVFIKFSDENKGNYYANDKQETKFQYGDIIEISCEGLSLEKAGESVQAARDESSVSMYGESVKDISDNPFLDVYTARELAQQVISAYSHPRRTVSVITKMRPGLTFVNQEEKRLFDRIDIYSQKHFPFDQGYTLRGELRSVEYLENQRMRLKIRALNPN